MNPEQPLPLYIFPNLSWFKAALSKSIQPIELEVNINWQKQSPRSRFEIVGPNGKQQLVIPTVKSTRKTLGEVCINYDENWPIQHWRSLETGYNRSPFFEFYKDDIKQILETRYKKLADLNFASIKWCCEKLQLDIHFVPTKIYKGETKIEHPFSKNLVYPQVFTLKNGFIPELSTLDVLFNLGSEASSLLR